MAASGNFDFLFKVMVVGEPDVGKTSLVRRFVEQNAPPALAGGGPAPPRRETTSGGATVEYNVRSLSLPHVGKGGERGPPGAKDNVKLQIWHAPGNPAFHSVTTGYFKDVDGIMIVYDLGSPDMISQVTKWIEDVSRYGRPKGTVVFLVGNKSDAPARDAMAQEEMQRRFHFPNFEVSSRTGHNVETTFERLAGLMRDKVVNPRKLNLSEPLAFSGDGTGPKPGARPDETGGGAGAGAGAGGTGGTGGGAGVEGAGGAGGGTGGEGAGGGGGGRASDDSDDEEGGGGGLGSKISSYFGGKFKRQRRRVKQKLLQKVNATDTTEDELYEKEKKTFLEFDERLGLMQERMRGLFTGFAAAFETGAQLGDDFRYFTVNSRAGAISETTSELIHEFGILMHDGREVARTLLADLEQSDVFQTGPAAAKAAAAAKRPPPSPAAQAGYLKDVRHRMEKRERALLDFDAYRRKMRNVMTKPAQGKDQAKTVEKLKKREAKLLGAQDTFEVMNSSLIHDFMESHDRRAAFMSDQFLGVLKTVMKMFMTVGRSLDAIVPLIRSGVAAGRRGSVAESNPLAGAAAALAAAGGGGGGGGGGAGAGAAAQHRRAPSGASSTTRSPAVSATSAVSFASAAAGGAGGGVGDAAGAAREPDWRPDDRDLGGGWTVFYTDDLLPYYHHEGSGESSWDRPTSVAAPSAAEVHDMKLAEDERARRARPANEPPVVPPPPTAPPPPDDSGGGIFVSREIDALFGDDLATLAEEERAAAAERMRARFAAFSLADGFERLHAASKPPDVSEPDGGWVPQEPRVRQASKFVRPPPLPASALAGAGVPSSASSSSSSSPVSASRRRVSSSPPVRAPPPRPARSSTVEPVPEEEPPRLSTVSSASSAAPGGGGGGGDFMGQDEMRSLLGIDDGPGHTTVLRSTALFAYEAQYEGDLSFAAGDEVLVTQWTEDSERSVGWWRGYCHGVNGFFPASYVSPLREIGDDEPAPDV